MTPLPDWIRFANATGDSPLNATDKVVTQWVRWYIRPTSHVLDYGAGRECHQTMRLREEGFAHVTAYDIGANLTPQHDRFALNRTYDVVMLSNVLNVVPSGEGKRIVESAARCLGPGGYLVVNLPETPRASGALTLNNFTRYLARRFASVVSPQPRLWIAADPKE